MGINGSAGDKGDMGVPGNPGLNGVDGLPGTKGPIGMDVRKLKSIRYTRLYCVIYYFLWQLPSM